MISDALLIVYRSYTRTERSGPQSVFITTNEEDPMASFILKYRTIGMTTLLSWSHH